MGHNNLLTVWMLTWSVNINTIQKKKNEGVLNISKKVRPAVKEGIKYLFMSNERNTGQYHNMKVATISSPECEKIQIFMNTQNRMGKHTLWNLPACNGICV